MQNHKPLFRFAPSPNGRLHLGHAYSALLNFKYAQELNGTCLLRIEDIDTTRCTPELTRHCLEDLRWLGLEWPQPVRVQSRHMADYAAALKTLEPYLYPCFCTRKQVAQAATATDPEGAPLYSGHCRSLNHAALLREGRAHSWRLNMEKALAAIGRPLHYSRMEAPHAPIAANPAPWGDVILARKETPTSYHLSVVVDDALQNITHVVRGQDLEAATDIHVLLQALLNLPTPLYHHHPLIRDESGEKLSKSKGSTPLHQLRQSGLTPQALRAGLGF